MPVTVTPETVTFVVPVFVTVTVCAADVVATVCPANVSDVGVSDALAVAPVPDSVTVRRRRSWRG